MPSLVDWLRTWVQIRANQPSLEKSMNAPGQRWHDPTFKCYMPLNFQSWIMGFPETKADLASLFDAIGVVENFEKTVCLFLTVILETVPDKCNCTSGRPFDDQPKEVTRVTHGVKHHGSSYNLTAEEQYLIHNLTQLDQELHDNAMELFKEKVASLERTYGVKICGET